MAEREASVRLTLNDRGFRASFDKSARDVEQSSSSLGKKMGAYLSAGANEGLKSVHALGSKVREIASLAGGIIGGAGFAGMVKGAIDGQQRFEQLTTRVQMGTGEMLRWNELQKEVEQTALQTNNTIEGMTNAFEMMFQETGNAKDTLASLNAIGTVSRETGAEIEGVARVAGVLQQKFGITQSEMGDALTQVATAAQQGGASLEDLSDDLGEIGGKAKTLGAQGPEGLRQMLGFLNAAKKESGNFQQAMTALPMILDQIIERTSKGVVTSSGRIPMKVQAVDKNGKPRPFPDILADIIKTTKGDQAALGEFGFGGEGLQTILGLAKDFEAAVKVSGGNVEDAKKLFATRLEEAAGASMKFAELQQKAANQSPADNIQTMLTKLEMAFSKPKMMEAVESLAENLPELAEGIASLLDFVVDSPMTAGALYVGGTFGSGAIKGMLEQAFQSGGAGAGKQIGTAMDAAGGRVANNLQNAVTAFGIAVAAWAAAAEQWEKLQKDLKQARQDDKDERGNALATAKLRGEKYAHREVEDPIAQAIKDKGFWGLDWEDVKGNKTTEIIEEGPDGKTRTRRIDRSKEDLAAPLDLDFDATDPTTFSGGTAAGDLGILVNKLAPPPAETTAKDDKTAAAVKGLQNETRGQAQRHAQALAGVELKMRVTNLNEIPKGHGPR